MTDVDAIAVLRRLLRERLRRDRRRAWLTFGLSRLVLLLILASAFLVAPSAADARGRSHGLVTHARTSTAHHSLNHTIRGLFGG